MDAYCAYSSIDSFLSPLPGSDWLVFCFGSLMLHQKKEMELTKTVFLSNNNQKMSKIACKHKSAFFTKNSQN